MPKTTTVRLGASDGTCLRCDAPATLTLYETRYVREWFRLLDRDFDPAASRTATCSVCAVTYPVRSTTAPDTRVPAGAHAAHARRRDGAEAPNGRDWAYPARRLTAAGSASL